MDLFPVAVLGSRNYFVWQNCGGVRVQVLEFLQHSVCTGTLYCVLIARTQGADLIQRGGIALRTATAAAAKAAAGALWQPGGRAGPGTLWFDVPHHTPAGHRSAIARVRCVRRLESWERLKERTAGPLGRGGAAERLRLRPVRGLWALCAKV